MDKTALLDIALQSLNSSMPEGCLPDFIPAPPENGMTYVLPIGKAAAKMAQVFEQHYRGTYDGVGVTRYGFDVPTDTIEILQAAHPVPDENGSLAASRIRALAEQATEQDLVIVLLSGGGSALLSDPHPDIPFADYQNLVSQLLKCGASIHEINAVRKHLSSLFGGRLAKAATPARILTLAISDVAGDDPSVIASGPTVPDTSTLADAKAVIAKYQLDASHAIRTFLDNPANETPKDNDPVFDNTTYTLIAAPSLLVKDAAARLGDAGFHTHIVSDCLEGDTNEAAQMHATLVRSILDGSMKHPLPCAIVSGGETTVMVKGDTGDTAPKGGPNAQFAMALAPALDDIASAYPDREIAALAIDTDGIDGHGDHAGAYVDTTTVSRATERGLDVQSMLGNNMSYDFFAALDDLVITGPTYTNVNDLRIIVIK